MPIAVSVSPSGSGGLSQTFTFVFSDSQSATNLAAAAMLFAGGPVAQNSCLIVYDLHQRFHWPQEHLHVRRRWRRIDQHGLGAEGNLDAQLAPVSRSLWVMGMIVVIAFVEFESSGRNHDRKVANS